MINFSMIGRVYGNPKIDEFELNGEKYKILRFALVDVDNMKCIFEMATSTRIFERGTMFIRDGNLLKVDGYIRTNWTPNYHKPNKIKVDLIVTQFMMLFKAKGIAKEYTSLLGLYPQIANVEEEGDLSVLVDTRQLQFEQRGKKTKRRKRRSKKQVEW